MKTSIIVLLLLNVLLHIRFLFVLHTPHIIYPITYWHQLKSQKTHKYYYMREIHSTDESKTRVPFLYHIYCRHKIAFLYLIYCWHKIAYNLSRVFLAERTRCMVKLLKIDEKACLTVYHFILQHNFFPKNAPQKEDGSTSAKNWGRRPRKKSLLIHTV